jgi:hypothetical protein
MPGCVAPRWNETRREWVLFAFREVTANGKTPSVELASGSKLALSSRSVSRSHDAEPEGGVPETPWGRIRLHRVTCGVPATQLTSLTTCH